MITFVHRKGSPVVHSEFELIRYNGNLPAKIERKQGKIDIPNHWHKEIELVYVLDGAVQVSVNGNPCRVGKDDMLLINSAENHCISAENAACMLLDISYEFIHRYDASLYHIVFEIGKGSGAEDEIRSLLWQLSRSAEDDELPALRQYAIITELLHVLLVQCRREREEPAASDAQVNSRHIKLATEYIGQHFREEITETELAEKLGVHPAYLCALFRKTLATTFGEYLLSIRLEHAMDALLNKHMSVEDAAKAGGFPSKRTFVAKCKRAYNISPFQMQKQGRG